MSGQQHAPAALCPWKEPVPIVQEAGWIPGPVWTGGKSRPHRDSIPGPSSPKSVAIPTEIPGPHEDSEGKWNFLLPSLLWHSAQVGRRSCHLQATAALYLQISEWTPGLLNADRRNRSLENCQHLYREFNPEPVAQCLKQLRLRWPLLPNFKQGFFGRWLPMNHPVSSFIRLCQMILELKPAVRQASV